ncbi:hypothetical protein PRUPE_1G548500 [Prunus persica]|uniref:nucleoside-diphosphate kinase n=1 Tax=Prunus persica TaxID=3760 RepID=A0A251RI16_PRUPE|nr:hypothetical protein PRUPE_1G548500 [Prunus persica]
MIWEGKNVILTGRKIIGATNPAKSSPGTVRGDYAIEIVNSRSRKRASGVRCSNCEPS